nr:hypothetical protein [Haliscomenobacter sp.]
MKILKFSILIICAVFLVDCTKDLDRTPENGLTADKLFANEAGYRSSLAKIYGGLSLTGNNGPDGSGDLGGIDEGFSSYLRNYWNLQELCTDEAVIGWNDQTIRIFTKWTGRLPITSCGPCTADCFTKLRWRTLSSASRKMGS